MVKRKKAAKELSVESQEVLEELEVAHLRKQLKQLKRLPKDFRDIEVMSDDWRSFASIMGTEKKKEMTEWSKGGVLCLIPPNALEKKVLTVYGKVEVLPSVCSLENILYSVEQFNYSFVYASEWPKHAIAGLNWLASHYEWNFRFRGQLISGRGLPLGVG